MKKAIQETQKEFESSSHRTPQYLAWHKLFRREFSNFLKEEGATKIEIHKPNHFDMSGFFTMNDTIWYFSICDVRGFIDTMLIRTAKDYKDFTGGQNKFASLKTPEAFVTEFRAATNPFKSNSGMFRKDTPDSV